MLSFIYRCYEHERTGIYLAYRLIVATNPAENPSNRKQSNRIHIEIVASRLDDKPKN